MKKTITIDNIDALLPQTQCGQCDYNGCKPYAKAILEKEATINRCPPGGVATLHALADLLEIDPQPLIADLKTKNDSVAVIREDTCIGCTKCIQACPTDAIIGASKQMHTIISDACTGCDLCIPVCPVDCIDSITIPKRSEAEKKQKADKWRQRYQQRNQRLERLKEKQAIADNQAPEPLEKRKAMIQQALQRTKAKKS